MEIHKVFGDAVRKALEAEADKEIDRAVQFFRRRLESARTEVVARLLEQTILTTNMDPVSPTIELRVTLLKDGDAR